ncbi:MAG: hypothetical protein JO036_21870 [Candidatus Eremiobacteraeota bacterium]|nr:hypothetical protein [Candidatus Eremiobacteraeota bacterium]
MRITGFRWESEMIAVLRSHFASVAAVVEELDVRHGRVDLCVYECEEQRAPISAPALRLYSKLHRRFVHLSELTLTLLASVRVLQQYARELEHHQLIDRRASLVRRRRAYRYPIRKIIAVEAKLADWQRACEQVLLHRGFAEELWIALDFKHVARVNIEQVKKHNIGVVATDRDGLFIMHPAVATPFSRSFALERAMVHESLLARQTSGDHDVSCMRAATLASSSAFDPLRLQAFASHALT